MLRERTTSIWVDRDKESTLQQNSQGYAKQQVHSEQVWVPHSEQIRVLIALLKYYYNDF